MKHLLTASIVLACALAQPALAQAEGPGVPIEKAPFHLPVFKNEYVTLLNVYLPPQRNTGYHTHTGDSVSVNIQEAEMTNQDLGQPQAGPPRRGERGRASYADYREQPKTHKASNVGTTPFHNISFIFRSPRPSGFTPSVRTDSAVYTQIMDNERVRGWRLVLAPGQSAPAISQSAPGLRIVIDGGEIVENVPGQPDRSMLLRTGEFFWQDAGVTRAVRNAGTSRVELVEFELK
jgi:quercetin dioxygenase-like cupin family protein